MWLRQFWIINNAVKIILKTFYFPPTVSGCEKTRLGKYSRHDRTHFLQATITLPRPESCAVSRFPEEVKLCISSLSSAVYGVVAQKFIPIGTYIGPYEGKRISVEEGVKQITQGDAPFLRAVSNCLQN